MPNAYCPIESISGDYKYGKYRRRFSLKFDFSWPFLKQFTFVEPTIENHNLKVKIMDEHDELL